VAVPLRKLIATVGSVGAANLVAALTGFVIMVVLAAKLPPASNAEFLVFWSVLFWVYGGVGGVQYEAVRSVRGTRSAVAESSTPVSTGARVVPVALGVAAAAVGLFFLSSLIWAPRVFPQDPYLLSGVIAVGGLLFAGHSAVIGTLGGQGRWPAAAILIAGESLGRFLALMGLVLLGCQLLPLKMVVPVGGLVWVVAVGVAPRFRRVWRVRADVSAPVFARNATQTMVANVASAALVVGFPTVLGLMIGHEAIQTIPGLLFAISMTRAPLMLPLNAFQSMLVAHFVANHRGGFLVKVVLGCAGVGLVLAAIVAVVGPPLLGLLRPEYHMSALVLAGLTLDATALALISVTGTFVLATKRHGWYMLGWLAAIAASVGFLAAGINLEWRVVIALLVGPAIGAGLHLAAVRRSGQPSVNQRDVGSGEVAKA